MDGISDLSDNCPFKNNPSQTPSIDDPTIGLACLCGDVNDDGTRMDAAAQDSRDVQELLAGVGSPLAAPDKCQVSPADACDLVTAAILARAAGGLLPSPQQACPAAR
jgi:hypothetical protein